MEESTIRKFLRMAISVFLYASIVASACIGIRSMPVEQEAWAILSPCYVLLFFIIVIPTSFYLGYRSTRKHCQCGKDVWMASFTFIIISTLTLLCVLYIILYEKEIMPPSFRRSTSIPKTVLSLVFSDYKFVFLAPVPFLVGAGIYWLVHGKRDQSEPVPSSLAGKSGQMEGIGKDTILTFLRVAGVSFLYTAIVVSACMSILLIPVKQEELFGLWGVYVYLFYIIVIPTSLYLGYRLTKKHYKNFGDVLM